MQGLNQYDMMAQFAATALANQKRNPNDYIGEDGLLVCGTCHAPKQKMMEIADPTPEDPNHKKPLMVTAMCRCEQEAERKKAEEKKAAEDMEKIRRLKGISLMDAQFETASFDKLQKTKYNAKNLAAGRRYAEKFGTMLEKNQGLLFWGPVGTGKSLLAACIANHLIEELKTPVMMTSFVKLLEAVQSGRENESDIIRRLNRAKLVIFDDLGAERSTDYAIERVYNIVDSRYRAKLPMILTTNLTLEEMKTETDIRYARIYDRVFETCYPMQFTGPSFRKKEASKRFDEMEKLLAED